MAKRKTKRRRRRKAAKITRRRSSRRGKWPKVDVRQTIKVSAALLGTEVLTERIDVPWLSEQALAFAILALWAKSESDRRVFTSCAIGSQIKEIADQTNLTDQIKRLIPGDTGALAGG